MFFNALPENPAAFLVLQMAGFLTGHIMFMYVIYGVFVLFIPIMGRSGSEAIPDVFIAVVVVVGVIVLMGYQVSRSDLSII